MQLRALLAAAVAAAAFHHPSALAQLPAPNAGLGGYKMCTTAGFTLNGHLDAAQSPVLSDQWDRLSGSGAASCTKDGSGASGWVPVTISFSGVDTRDLQCSLDNLGKYVLAGPFTLNDGTSTYSTDAVLTITTIDTNLLGTRTIAADFDLPDVQMKSSFHAETYPPVGPFKPVDLGELSMDLTVADCYQPRIDQLTLTGSVDIVLSASDALEYATGATSIYALLPPEVQQLVPDVGVQIPTVVKSQLPDDYAQRAEEVLNPALGAIGEEIDEVVALGLASAIDIFTSAFGVTADTPGLPSLAESAPYMITIKYKTALGSQTLQQVGVPGVRTSVAVPNYNNSMLPELVHFTVSGTSGQYALLIERASSARPLAMDAKVSVPPVAQLQSVSDVALELGYEGLSVVNGSAPTRFEITSASASSDNANQSSVIVRTEKGAATTFDAVGRYQVLSEGTDLRLRVTYGSNPASALQFDSFRQNKKRTLWYRADRVVPKIALTGSDKGKELNATLSDVALSLDFCSDKGNGCVLPWRTYQCGCTQYGTVRYISILGRQIPIRGCTQPQYCPIAAENSASFTSITNDAYDPTTLNLTLHNPSTNDSGTVVSDDVTKVTNLSLSQFGFDKRTGDYPKRIYFDTRRETVSGAFQQATYNASGSRTKSLTISGTFSAWGREFTLKKHDIKIFGEKIGHYYSIDRKGSMSCSGFNIDTGGELPGWVESILESIIC